MDTIVTKECIVPIPFSLSLFNYREEEEDREQTKLEKNFLHQSLTDF